MPTKTFPTQHAIAWLKTLVLPEIDRLELDHLLADLEHIECRIEELDEVIAQRCKISDDAVLLATIPGAGAFTVVSLACRTGRIDRFPRSRSLANYWGLAPGCRNSGENSKRLGSITKAGHDHLAYANAAHYVRGVPRDLDRLNQPNKPFRNRNNKAYMVET